jgi:ribosomal protein S18 acetylase RimI-like enzyme
MSVNVTVVQADLHNHIHVADILRLLNHYAADIMGGGEELPLNVRQTLIAKLQKRSGVVILLAYGGDNALGLVIAFEGFSTFYAMPLMNIHDFVVEEASRGKGIARLMLDKIEEIALERGCCKLTLEVLEGNERAQKVYQKFGFASYVLDPEMGRALFLDKKLNKGSN